MKKGFTLIEVLIVVIILGILATLAIPQFTKMTKRATLAEAWAGLGGIRTAQAVFYMENESYATALTDLDFDAPSAGIFSYSIPSSVTSTFTAMAQGSTTRSSGVTAWIWPAASSSTID